MISAGKIYNFHKVQWTTYNSINFNIYRERENRNRNKCKYQNHKLPVLDQKFNINDEGRVEKEVKKIKIRNPAE